MKLYNPILWMALLLGCVTHAQTKSALLIGIGNYPQESGWCTIHGDNDIPIVVSRTAPLFLGNVPLMFLG